MSIKRIVCFNLILTLVFSLAATALAAEPTTTKAVSTTLDRADALKDMGLFMGTGSGFDLERAPTRTEAVVMLLRMLGEEKMAQNSSYTSPFTDVPAWAAKNIAYAYNKGYTSGTSKTTLGSNDLVTPEQFFTFMLRALGYSDKNGDFVWSVSIQKAESLGIVPAGKYKTGAKFTRGDCVDTIYSVLSSNKKDGKVTLAKSLVDSKAVDSNVAEKYGLYTSAQTLSPTTQKLYDLGLFSESDFLGVPIFSLDRAPTKLEATVMYIKILGREQAALAVEDARGEHPFTDVPAWAKKYVAYAYWNNLLSGNTDTTFGITDTIAIEQFLTYVLRALEYDSTDFDQAKSIIKAEEIGLIPIGKYSSNSKFKCSDCADIIFNALKLSKKLEGITIAQSLIYYGEISDITAAKYSLIPSAYERIKVPIKLEGKDNILYNKDVISAIPNAKFMNFGGIGSNAKMPFSYYRTFSMRDYNDLSKTAADATLYEYFTENYNNLNNYAGGKPGYGFTIATVYDATYNIIAAAIFDANSAIAAGNVEFVSINIDTKKRLDYLTTLSTRIVSTAKELPSDAFHFERYKELITFVDKTTGKQKGESILNNNGSYYYKIIINKEKYPELASAITGFNDVFINDQPITAESLVNEVTIVLSDPFSNGKYNMSNSISNCLSNWAVRDYEWNRKRAFIFGDANGSIIGWVNYLPSQVKIVDIGTIETTIYK